MTRPPRELTPHHSARDFYGGELRRMRTEANLTLEGLASRKEIHYSKSQLQRVEIAEIIPPPGLSEALDKVFGTDRHFWRLNELVLHNQEIHPKRYRHRMAMEERARVIQEYSGPIVPGLIQTEAYARALFRAYRPEVDEEQIEEKVTARLSRQELLRADPPLDLSVILDEAAIRRPVGGPAVMGKQLASVLELVDTPTTVVQLLPFEHGEHGLMGGMLTLMTLSDGTAVAYEESIDTGTLLKDPEIVSAHQRTYDLLRSYALSPSETAKFIRSVMEAYTA